MAYCFLWLPLNIQILYDVAGSAHWTVMAVPGDGCIHVLSIFVGISFKPLPYLQQRFDFIENFSMLQIAHVTPVFHFIILFVSFRR